MKAIFYIDGFNLFYGCLKNSPYKWLDLFSMSKNILNEQSPGFEIEKVKYFTSPIKGQLATKKEEAVKAQNNYIRALEKTYPEKFSTIRGYFSEPKCVHMCEFIEGHPPDKSKRVEVWKHEEKQTDVSMALEIYRDAMKGNADLLIVVSNDSDLEPSVRAIREDFVNIKIGIVMPVYYDKESTTGRIPSPNHRLDQHAHWTRAFISKAVLESSQLPTIVETRRKKIHKPDYW